MGLSKNPELVAFWISFPEDPQLPLGIGVTATSEHDAFNLIKQQNFEWLDLDVKTQVTSNVTIDDLDQSNIVPNIGPMQFRGVWYPAMNIGYGAPQDSEYKPIRK